MNRCAGRLIRDIIVVIVISLGASVTVFTYQVWDGSNVSYDRSLWLQSTEQQLKNQNEEYYTNLYDRYSRIQRDLNDYQYFMQGRLETLEKRIENLEEQVNQKYSVNINNNNSGRDSSINQ